MNAKVEMSKFLREVVHERNRQLIAKGSKHADLAREFADFQASLVAAKPGTVFPSEEQLRLQMENWLELSLNRSTPYVLLLWTRAVLMGLDLSLLVEEEQSTAEEEATVLLKRVDERLEDRLKEQEEHMEETKKELQRVKAE